MTYETILYRVEDGVAWITLNRPALLNAFSPQMRADLMHALRRAPDEARALVLTGAGRAFSSGQDLGDGANVGSLDLERLLRDEYAPIVLALARCPIPTLAAVNGVAAGGGANIALAADVVVAAEGASFLQAFARIGLMPDLGGTWFAPRRVGVARALGAALLADEIPARQAADWGLIWEAVPDPDFMPRVRALARRLADGPTEAYRRIKIAMRESAHNDLESQLDLEAHLQGELGKTRDFVEGVMAFVEKRPPEFEGR